MKRIGLLAIAIILVTFPSFSQYVRFQDRYFAQALIEAGVDTNHDRMISYTEAETVTSLEVNGWCSDWYGRWGGCEEEITSLAGIEAFVNLQTLSCTGNQLGSLDLSQNIALYSLNCSESQITSLNVSGLTALHDLDCSGNGLTSLDVSGLTALHDLDCSGNGLTSLDVSGCTAL